MDCFNKIKKKTKMMRLINMKTMSLNAKANARKKCLNAKSDVKILDHNVVQDVI